MSDLNNVYNKKAKRENKKMKEETSKVLELISVLGVGIVGIGIGAVFAEYFKQFSLLIILIGLFIHGVAMYKIHAENKKEIFLSKFFYWLCWMVIILIVIYVVAK